MGTVVPDVVVRGLSEAVGLKALYGPEFASRIEATITPSTDFWGNETKQHMYAINYIKSGVVLLL